MHARDQNVMTAADVLIPIAVRPDGTMARLWEQERHRGKTIVDEFQTQKRSPAIKHAYQVSADQLNPDLRQLDGDYVTHYTRTANGPWPHENLLDYYRAVAASDTYPRQAAATLANIIVTGRIVASALHMPSNIPTVSFTTLRPTEVLPLIRWRSRYGQMSFEPYAVAIESDWARKLGIVPVEYHRRGGYAGVPDDLAWRCQSVGIKSDWRRERESRCRGDCDLTALPSDAMLLLTRFRQEADKLSSATGLRAISFLDK
jgi:hypothetical protein